MKLENLQFFLTGFNNVSNICSIEIMLFPRSRVLSAYVTIYIFLIEINKVLIGWNLRVFVYVILIFLSVIFFQLNLK